MLAWAVDHDAMKLEWVGYGLEGTLLLAGVLLYVGWRGWRRRGLPRYRPWPNLGSDIALCLLIVIGCIGALIYAIRIFGTRFLPPDPDEQQLAATLALEAAMLLALAVFNWAYKPLGLSRPSPGAAAEAVKFGPLTFLLAWPIVFAVMAGWQGMLQLLHYPVDQQETVKMFERLPGFGPKLEFITFAVVIAPVTEELIFRGVLFRGLAKFIPRGYAIWISAVVFGAVHGDMTSFLPLVVFGAMLAVAYERTGNIAVTMTAHALFNLNTIVGLLLGLTT